MSAQIRRPGEQPYESSKNVTLGETKTGEPAAKFTKGEFSMLKAGQGFSSRGAGRLGGGASNDGSASREVRWEELDGLEMGNELSSLEELGDVVYPPAVDTRSEEERSRERNRQREKKKSHKKRSHHHGGEDEAEEGEEASASVVPHAAGAAAAATFKTLTLEQIRLENFRINQGITISPNDQIDLENTSCESSDDDSCCSHNEDDADDEFRVKKTAEDDDEDEEESASHASFDPLGDEFDQHARDGFMRRENERRRRKKRRKTGEKTGAGVASDYGRLNHCFLCAWGKRTDDEVNNEHMEKLWRILHSNIGEVPMKYIALAMHGYYRTVLRPAAEARGQKLPRWRSKHIFICITTHNKIPQVALDHDLGVLDTMQGFLERKIGVQPITSTSDDKPVREMMKELRETMAIKWRLYAMPISRMNFHSDDRNIKLGSNQQNFRGLVLAKSTSRAGAPLTAASAAKKFK